MLGGISSPQGLDVCKNWPMENPCGSVLFSQSGWAGQSDSTLTWLTSQPMRKVSTYLLFHRINSTFVSKNALDLIKGLSQDISNKA